ISDFLDTDPSSALKAAAARHDVIAIELFDPRDHRPPSAGPVVARDAETGRLAVVGGKRWARRMAEARYHRRQDLLRLVRKLGVDHLEIRTDRPYLPTLVDFFKRRRQRFSR
ncbi:MAG: DUF58 domain-containing protein, partial [Acidobacteriota bacterium]